MSIMQKLYDSEINCSISTFWDGGFEWKLGDDWNGISASGNADTFAEAGKQLAAAAMERYPDSKFTHSMLAAALGEAAEQYAATLPQPMRGTSA